MNDVLNDTCELIELPQKIRRWAGENGAHVFWSKRYKMLKEYLDRDFNIKLSRKVLMRSCLWELALCDFLYANKNIFLYKAGEKNNFIDCIKTDRSNKPDFLFMINNKRCFLEATHVGCELKLLLEKLLIDFIENHNIIMLIENIIKQTNKRDYSFETSKQYRKKKYKYSSGKCTLQYSLHEVISLFVLYKKHKKDNTHVVIEKVIQELTNFFSGIHYKFRMDSIKDANVVLHAWRKKKIKKIILEKIGPKTEAKRQKITGLKLILHSVSFYYILAISFDNIFYAMPDWERLVEEICLELFTSKVSHHVSGILFNPTWHAYFPLNADAKWEGGPKNRFYFIKNTHAQIPLDANIENEMASMCRLYRAL